MAQSIHLSLLRIQKGRIKAPLGGIQLLDRGSTCLEAAKHFSEAERRDPSYAAAIRAKAVLEIFKRQEKELERADLFTPLMEIEMPLVRVLSHMECRGICLDRRVYNLSRFPLLRRQEEVGYAYYCMTTSISEDLLLKINQSPL